MTGRSWQRDAEESAPYRRCHCGVWRRVGDPRHRGLRHVLGYVWHEPRDAAYAYRGRLLCRLGRCNRTCEGRPDHREVPR